MASQRLTRSFQAPRSALSTLLGLSLWILCASADAGRELVFLTWADYLDPEIATEFEQRCDCTLRQVFFETDDARDNLLVESEGGSYDVIMVNGLMLHSYQKRGWLSPIEAHAIPNLAQLDPKWRSAFDAAEDYAVPYFWGTMGIAYRKDLVPTPLARWRDLFDPQAALQGRIAMIDSARDLMTAPLKSLGASLNTTDPDMLRRAEDLLTAQKPHVRSYSYVALTEDSSLIKGETVAAMMFNGDALMLQEHNPDIVFVLPEEGGQIWVDYLTIAARSSNPDLAAAFIDFLNEPQIAARNAQFVHYATPNQGATRLLPESFLQDPVIYPDAAALRNSEYYTRLPPRIERSYNDIFTRVVE